MHDTILPLPQIPEGLIVAGNTGTLVPFIGAGVSMLAGGPSWSVFADQALQHLVKGNKFSFSQIDQVRSLSPRQRLAVATRLQKETNSRIEFEEILHPDKNPQKSDGEKAYGLISRLSTTFVTTNYDRWLDKDYSTPTTSAVTSAKADSSLTPLSAPMALRSDRQVFFEKKDFTPDKLSMGGAVIHLHGSVADPSSMVMTTRDYLSHYANDRNSTPDHENHVLTFLEQLFATRNVLFIGYGLDELEILEYVVAKSGGGSKEEIRHYMLQGFFSHELELSRQLSSYYRDFSIQLIPFSRDTKDWHQVIEVLEHISTRIQRTDPVALARISDMEQMLYD